MDEPFEIPIPQLSIPRFVSDETTDVGPFPTINTTIGCLLSFRFDVKSEMFDIAPFVRSVTYGYKPQQLTLVLADIRMPDKHNPIFSWIKGLLRGTDDVTVTTLLDNGEPAYENEFLGCRLIHHDCPMGYDIESEVRHTVLLSYDHCNTTYNNKGDR